MTMCRHCGGESQHRLWCVLQPGRIRERDDELADVIAQQRAAGFPVLDPVDPAEIEAEVDAIMAASEPERRADRLAAGIVDSYALEAPPATMTVRIRDRSAEAPWGYGLNRPVVRTVTISAHCPVCGGPRGVPRNLNQAEDGEHYSADIWTNSCGHVDADADVAREAYELEVATALHAAGYSDPLPMPGTAWRDLKATWFPPGQRRMVHIRSVGNTVYGWQVRVKGMVVDADGTVVEGPINGIIFVDHLLAGYRFEGGAA